MQHLSFSHPLTRICSTLTPMALPSAISADPITPSESIPDNASTDSESTNFEAPAGESQDPRIRRTRQLLQQALATLLHTREFDKLSVHEITDAAGVNRATFYAHYPDKFALLECMVAGRFHALLDGRGIVFDGSCSNALTGIVLGVCDFLAQSLTQSTPIPCPSATHLPPHMETAIVNVVRGMLLDGLRNHPADPSTPSPASPELLAATAAWAIYGAAREWVRTPNHAPSEEVALTVQRLVAPILHFHPA
jgi:AcrR family transcriptional regulator